jgi:hypothetical protein
MISLRLQLWFLVIGQLAQAPARQPPDVNEPLEKSAYFAFVDHDYIFTIEVVKPGIPLLNFVSMADQDVSLPAKNVRLTLENRKSAARLFGVEAGDFQQPIVVPSLTIHPRSSFGVRIEGDFDKATELQGAAIRLGDEDLKLAPLTSFDFESLVLKVNRINLGSPDFSGDWHVLRLEQLGSRSPARKGKF